MIVAYRSSAWAVVRYVGTPLILMFALDFAVAVAYVFGGWTWLSLPDVPLSIFGGTIGVITGFRNTSAYARWWEARTIWGSIVNNSRTFARQVLSMIDSDETSRAGEVNEVKRTLIDLQIGYVHALRNHLRGTPPWDELTELVPPREIEYLKASQQNVPLGIQNYIACMLRRCYQQGWIDNKRWTTLDRTLSVLMDCQGASERIKNTPMPLQYDTYIRVFISIFCVLLPLGMVSRLGIWTPFGSTLVALSFLALDQIGRDLETPFENLPHDVSITAISRTIEINLKQIAGEKDVPAPLAPVDGILW